MDLTSERILEKEKEISGILGTFCNDLGTGVAFTHKMDICSVQSSYESIRKEIWNETNIKNLFESIERNTSPSTYYWGYRNSLYKDRLAIAAPLPDFETIGLLSLLNEKVLICDPFFSVLSYIHETYEELDNNPDQTLDIVKSMGFKDKDEMNKFHIALFANTLPVFAVLPIISENQAVQLIPPTTVLFTRKEREKMIMSAIENEITEFFNLWDEGVANPPVITSQFLTNVMPPEQVQALFQCDGETRVQIIEPYLPSIEQHIITIAVETRIADILSRSKSNISSYTDNLDAWELIKWQSSNKRIKSSIYDDILYVKTLENSKIKVFMNSPLNLYPLLKKEDCTVQMRDFLNGTYREIKKATDGNDIQLIARNYNKELFKKTQIFEKGVLTAQKNAITKLAIQGIASMISFSATALLTSNIPAAAITAVSTQASLGAQQILDISNKRKNPVYWLLYIQKIQDNLTKKDKSTMTDLLKKSFKLIEKRKLDEAYKCYLSVLEIDQNNIIALCNSSTLLAGPAAVGSSGALEREGCYKKALNRLERAIEYSTIHPMLMQNKIVILSLQGRFEEASEALDSYLEIFGSNEYIEYLVRTIKNKNKSFEIRLFSFNKIDIENTPSW
jgi:tetratricopeptide (TPR) repeat protein